MCVFPEIFVGHIKKSKKKMIETYTFSFGARGLLIIFFTKIFQRNTYSIFV